MSRMLERQLNRAMIGEDEQDDTPADDRPLIDQFMDYGSHTMFDGPVSQDQDGKAWHVRDGGLVLDRTDGWQSKPAVLSWSPMTAVWQATIYRWDNTTMEWKKFNAQESDNQ